MYEQAATSIAAIAALTVIEIKAIDKGINGKLMAAIAAIIGGIAGYNVESILGYL